MLSSHGPAARACMTLDTHPPERAAIEPAGVDLRPLLLGMEWFPDVPQGVGRFVRELAFALERRGVDPEVVAAGGALDAPSWVRSCGDRSPQLVRVLRYWRRAAAAADRVSLVNVHFALYGIAPVVMSPLRRLPLVVHYHGPWSAESKASGQRSQAILWTKQQLEARLYQRSDRFIALSTAFADVLRDEHRVPPERIRVIPPGVDTARFRPQARDDARVRLGWTDERTVVLAVRRLVQRVGIDVLLDAWRLMVELHPHFVLVVVGDGPLRSALEGRARALGISESVRFVGRVADDALVDWYALADLSVVPSTSLEGFGLVVLESLACGVPVVATRVGGLPEALSGLDSSLIVDPRDAAQLARRIRDALTATRNVPTGEECRRYAETFSWDATAARTLDVFREAVASRASVSRRAAAAS